MADEGVFHFVRLRITDRICKRLSSDLSKNTDRWGLVFGWCRIGGKKIIAHQHMKRQKHRLFPIAAYFDRAVTVSFAFPTAALRPLVPEELRMNLSLYTRYAAQWSVSSEFQFCHCNFLSVSMESYRRCCCKEGGVMVTEKRRQMRCSQASGDPLPRNPLA